jgi:drug/metabolite transporter (DMT)-like permease
VLVPVFLGLFSRQRIGSAIWAGAFAAVAGLYYLTVPSSGFGDLNRGDLLVLCGSVAFALHIIAIGRYARRHSPRVLNLLQVTTTMLLICLTGLLRTAAGRESFQVAWTGRLVAALI